MIDFQSGGSGMPMDGGSAASTPSYASNLSAGSSSAAAKFLTNLPSRGLFSVTVPSSQLGGLRVYICDHDTSPPEDQLIKTNQTNILIRSLMLKNQKGESSSKEGKGPYANQVTRKRAADKVLDKASGKRAILCSSQADSSPLLDKDLMSLKVEKLRALLKEKGLSVKGKKDELIARLRGADG